MCYTLYYFVYFFFMFDCENLRILHVYADVLADQQNMFEQLTKIYVFKDLIIP